MSDMTRHRSSRQGPADEADASKRIAFIWPIERVNPLPPAEGQVAIIAAEHAVGLVEHD